MSVLFQTVINTGKVFSLNKALGVSFSKCKCLSLRKYSDLPKKIVGFNDIVAQRRAEAKRSLIVQVNSESSFNELFCYCSKYADINGIHHYRNSEGEHFMLVEFKSEDCLRDVLQNCGSHQKDVEVMPSNSPFLWFRAVCGKKEKLSTAQAQSLLTKDGTSVIDDDLLYEELMKCSTVSEQIEQLFEKTKLNDLGVRLRYMVARHLEVLFSSLYANVEVKPFGSSVNGFGKMGCDLDLILTSTTSQETSVDRRLVYQEKRCPGSQDAWRRQLELAAEVLEARAAGARRVLRVLHARVPIVKFSHQLTGVECDLCFNNLSGIHMSAWLYSCGGLLPVVRPLTLAVRRWAQSVGLTSAHPGRWITSFPLSLLVLFYLQQKQLLPPLKAFLHDNGRIANDDGKCTFLRDLHDIPPESYKQNNANLETLLLQFFEFYAQFDFQEKAISLNQGAAVRKPNSQPLYVINPLDQSLNVSRNVSYEECQKLQVEVRNAAWQLEAELEGQKGEDWGILGLIERKASRNLKKLVKMGNSHRLVSIKDLFQDADEISENSIKRNERGKSYEEIESSVKEMKERLNKEPEKVKETVRFKNRQVANEVYRIRRDKIL